MYLTETSPSYTRIQRDSLGTMPMAVAGALRGCPRIPRNERFGCDSHARMHPKREMLSVPTQCVTENLRCVWVVNAFVWVSHRKFPGSIITVPVLQQVISTSSMKRWKTFKAGHRGVSNTLQVLHVRVGWYFGTQQIQDVVFCTARDALRCIKMGRCYNQWLAASHAENWEPQQLPFSCNAWWCSMLPSQSRVQSPRDGEPL